MNEPEAMLWMNRLVESSRADGALPDPALIWWKARLLDRQAAQARVARPMAIAQWGSVAAAVVTIVVLGVMNWAGITGMLAPAGIAAPAVATGTVVAMALALRFVFSE